MTLLLLTMVVPLLVLMTLLPVQLAVVIPLVLVLLPLLLLTLPRVILLLLFLLVVQLVLRLAVDHHRHQPQTCCKLWRSGAVLHRCCRHLRKPLHTAGMQ